ncbi:probable LRR receptor-like serine/threonine-protein kinase At3g47570 [Lycium barbarum]|uniref:probable LRR receptor-like serine/threonine-protein kinase At3g47570 n=1 Tax=Lycium barbarum TaxID=112863 RepID=UPI00293E0DC2|nr:probable LRR receptor-like serine/threonine-protein kinase At3g47570 [Lycium barbarum]
MEKYILLLIHLFLVQYFSFSLSATSSNETDLQALLAFQNFITNPSHFLARNWTKNTSFCSWFGVTCSTKRQRVVALALPNLQLQGTISPSLANLSFLRELNLGNNSFHGGIPYGIGHLPHLRVIDIQNNKLEGSIPTTLFQHQRVQKISLAYNKLSGEMWEGLWYVPELRILNLMNNGLMGIIPLSVGNATKLLYFNLSNNKVSGNIPKAIGNLRQLKKLSLYNNQLTGSIPAVLFNISSLLYLSLTFNSLSGPLLLDEGNIESNLELLSISYNQISGQIPYNICQLTELNGLSISINNITGEIPKNIACLSKLEKFYIGDNPIKGTIPPSLGNMSTLRNLYCESSRLEGPIPPELGRLSNLRQINFANNKLNGQIPTAIFNISSLERIDFSFNNLSGRIAATTGLHLPNLVELLLGKNQIKGEIPLFITNASKLENLELAGNFLTGPIPTNLGNLRELRLLLLHTNQLTNEPREHELRFFYSLANCRMLRYLGVGSNPLNGVFPNSIGNLSSTIEFFEIGVTHINGLIPTSIGNMSGLIFLSFEGNNLVGSIPSDVGKLKQLQGLFLTSNNLQGHIPEAICHLSNLVQLSLEDNEIFGLIPACIGHLSMLQQLYLGSNKFSSNFPLSLWKMRGLLFLSVSRNSIDGEVPSDIGELKTIVDLDLSVNHFSGMIPSRLGELQNLKSLNLSNNSISGPIPLSFANLISLEILDLSINALSGGIHRSLEKLLYLKNINVSFNDFKGEIPSGGVFANSTPQSFLGNRGLCGMHILEVPACAITNPEQRSKSKEFVLRVVTPVVISSVMICLLVSIWIMKQKKNGKSKDVEKVLEMKTYPFISYHEIQRATNNFDGSNLIGVGSSGSVYKGTLSSGTVMAVKVLDLENEEVCKRFDTECEVIRNVRHRNLIPVITTCSSEYIRAFVLRYMPNGSLDNWLYKEESHLNLLQRVAIMLDVAVAIEYLHHGHVTPIVHCDLKPSNVLLDEEMVAHVGDFSISKILAVSKSTAHTETLGTLGYIAPEYGSEGRVSISADVYSYGIMLMEVLAKRRPTDEAIHNENLGLREWIRCAFPRSMMEVVDASLFHEKEQITSKSEVCIASMIELALDCTEKKSESRITMKDPVLEDIANTANVHKKMQCHIRSPGEQLPVSSISFKRSHHPFLKKITMEDLTVLMSDYDNQSDTFGMPFLPFPEDVMSWNGSDSLIVVFLHM